MTYKGMEAALESVMKTLRISDDRTKYTTWLACLTSDQKARDFMGFDGILWDLMGFDGILWDFVGFDGI